MVNPENVKNILDDHFDQLTTDEFEERRRKSVGDEQVIVPSMDLSGPENQLMLFQPDPITLKLDAYLATALTGLNEDQRSRLFKVSDIVESVCKSLNIELYQPRKATDPVHHSDVSAETVYLTDRKRVLSSDLLIHICDYPSTGAGQELDFAFNALLPVVLIAHGDTRISRMITGIPGVKLEVTYTDLDELRIDLTERLSEIRPILEERKMSFSEYDKNLIGNRILHMRQELGLTREEIASSSRGILTSEDLRLIEESTDKVSNPPLLKLRALATILKTTVADLVEPDLNERVLILLQDWLEGKHAARFSMSIKDRNLILRRILYRVLDSLESD